MTTNTNSSHFPIALIADLFAANARLYDRAANEFAIGELVDDIKVRQSAVLTALRHSLAANGVEDSFPDLAALAAYHASATEEISEEAAIPADRYGSLLRIESVRAAGVHLIDSIIATCEGLLGSTVLSRLKEMKDDIDSLDMHEFNKIVEGQNHNSRRDI